MATTKTIRPHFASKTADVIALARKGDKTAREELTHRKCPSAKLALKELAGDKSVHQELELRVKRATGKASAKDLSALEKIKAEKKAARATKIAESKAAKAAPAKAPAKKAAPAKAEAAPTIPADIAALMKQMDEMRAQMAAFICTPVKGRKAR